VEEDVVYTIRCDREGELDRVSKRCSGLLVEVLTSAIPVRIVNSQLESNPIIVPLVRWLNYGCARVVIKALKAEKRNKKQVRSYQPFKDAFHASILCTFLLYCGYTDLSSYMHQLGTCSAFPNELWT
jgi:hypothetical protein